MKTVQGTRTDALLKFLETACDEEIEELYRDQGPDTKAVIEKTRRALVRAAVGEASPQSDWDRALHSFSGRRVFAVSISVLAMVVCALELVLVAVLFQSQHTPAKDAVAGVNSVSRQREVFNNIERTIAKQPKKSWALRRPRLKSRKNSIQPDFDNGSSDRNGFSALSNASDGEINALVIDSTVLITGNRSVGTGIILQKVDNKRQGKNEYVLLTAAHVLSACMREDGTTTIRFHRKNENDPLKWETEDQQIKLADAGRPLWAKHPTADVAALAIEVPEGLINTALPTTVLAEKQTLKGMSTGRDVFALGYPFAERGQSGFPLLRRAEIVSPMTGDEGSFAVSFQVYPGDSGGPVYSIEHNEKGSQLHILGLMVDSRIATEPRTQYDGGVQIRHSLEIGYAATSTEILRTASLLRARQGPESGDGATVTCMCGIEGDRGPSSSRCRPIDG